MAADDVFKDLAGNRRERDGAVVFWGMAVSFLEGADVCLHVAARQEGGCRCLGSAAIGNLSFSFVFSLGLLHISS